MCSIILSAEVEKNSFPNWSSFLAWKEEEEARTYTSFVQPKGKTLTGNNSNSTLFSSYYSMLSSFLANTFHPLSKFTRQIRQMQFSTSVISSYGFSSFSERTQTILYVCCRDGKSRENIWGRKTSTTRQKTESRKMNNGFCISRMTVTKDLVTGEVNVVYISTHSGHQPCREELRFLPIPQSLGKEVKYKFAQGITIEKIMDGKFTSVAKKFGHNAIFVYIFRYQSWTCRTDHSDKLQGHNRA